jgi:hypothetical protein
MMFFSVSNCKPARSTVVGALSTIRIAGSCGFMPQSARPWTIHSVDHWHRCRKTFRSTQPFGLIARQRLHVCMASSASSTHFGPAETNDGGGASPGLLGHGTTVTWGVRRGFCVSRTCLGGHHNHAIAGRRHHHLGHVPYHHRLYCPEETRPLVEPRSDRPRRCVLPPLALQGFGPVEAPASAQHPYPCPFPSSVDILAEYCSVRSCQVGAEHHSRAACICGANRSRLLASSHFA